MLSPYQLVWIAQKLKHCITLQLYTSFVYLPLLSVKHRNCSPISSSTDSVQQKATLETDESPAVFFLSFDKYIHVYIFKRERELVKQCYTYSNKNFFLNKTNSVYIFVGYRAVIIELEVNLYFQQCLL